MLSFRTLLSATLLLAFCTVTAGFFGPPSSGSDAGPTLPIEVLPPDGGSVHTKTVFVNVSDARRARTLYLQCHACGYEKSQKGEREGYDSKASVRVNGGAWMPLSNANANVYELERAYEGIGGAFSAVRMTLDVSNFQRGANRIEFRFNGTEGISSGYRIIDLDVTDAGGASLLSTPLTQEAPSTWAAPEGYASPGAVEEGRRLWHSATLRESPLDSKRLQVSCASCHATDGRDLKYFNFSNESIVGRSRFHGLTTEQGKKIAAYIRAVDLNLPAGYDVDDTGRPWNPPYQPGPGLEEKPVELWAAGAGLDAVLERDEDMAPYIMDEVRAGKTDVHAQIEIVGMPLAVQFPDWNEWLPDLHPFDAYGKDYFQNTRQHEAYLRATDALRTQPRSQLITEAREEAGGHIRDGGLIELLEPITYNTGDPSYNVKPGLDKFVAAMGHHQWAVIKTWELHQKYKLEDLGEEIFDKPGQDIFYRDRAWLQQQKQTFMVAPHMNSRPEYPKDGPFATEVKNNHMSRLWYQVQMTLSGGQRMVPGNNGPMDWQYHFNHITSSGAHAGRKIGRPMPQLAAQVHSEIVAVQSEFSRDFSFDKSDGGWGRHNWAWRRVNPTRLLWTYGEWEGLTEDYDPALRSDLLEAYLRPWLDEATQHDPAEWAREPLSRGGTARGTSLPSMDYVPDLDKTSTTRRGVRSYQPADNVLRVVPRMKRFGLKAGLIKNWIAWGEQMWPRGDWDALREGLNVTPAVRLTAPAPGSAEYASQLTLLAEASDEDGAIERVTFAANGTTLGQATRSSSAFAYDWKDVPAGSYRLTAIAVDDQGATTTSDPVQITVEEVEEEVIDDQGGDTAITRLMLVNADTNEDIRPLTDGDVLDLSALPTEHLTVRADVGKGVRSVRFALDGDANYALESVAPYALEGDANGDYHAWTLGLGQHALEATPYDGGRGSGTAGSPLSVRLTLGRDLGGEEESNGEGSGNVVFAINAGGDAFTDASGQSYQADTGFEGGQTYARNEAVSGTDADALYQSERFGDFSYAIPLEDGTYEVVLRLAEIYYDGEGKRVFDVRIENEERISDLDLFAQAGANTAYDVTKIAEVSDGELNLTFSTDVDNAKLSALLVRQASASGGPSVTQLMLVNADTNEDIRPLTDGDVLDLSALPTEHLTVRADVGKGVRSVRFALDGDANYALESVAPYALEGDANGDYHAWTLGLGQHALEATPYDGGRGSGTAGSPLSVSFTLSDGPSVTQLMLVNADTNEDIRPLTDGDVLDLSALPTEHLTVRADIGEGVRSVRFALDGNADHRTESAAPYALFGDTNGDYHAWSLGLGRHTLKATPYERPRGDGEAGLPLSVSFTLSESPAQNSVELDPVQIQKIALIEGWNLISSRLVPSDARMENVFQDVASKVVLVKDEEGRIYMPVHGVNDIGSWDVQEAYQVFTTAAFTLQIEGEALESEVSTVLLQAGWNFMPYLQDAPRPIAEVLAPLGSSLVFAKNNAGQSYIPAYGIDDIGMMQPGQGYKVYVSSDVPLAFAPEPASTEEGRSGDVALAQQVPARSAGAPAGPNAAAPSAGVPSSALLLVEKANLREGDLLTVHGSDNRTVGEARFAGGMAALLIRGDEQATTDIVEGARPGEALTLTVRSGTNAKLRTVAVEALEDVLTGRPSAHTFSYQAEALHTADLTLKSSSFTLSKNTPNPFAQSTTLRYSLPERAHVRIDVYDVLGRHVASLVDASKNAGSHHVRFDGTHVASGTYFCRFQAGGVSKTQRMTLVK